LRSGVFATRSAVSAQAAERVRRFSPHGRLLPGQRAHRVGRVGRSRRSTNRKKNVMAHHTLLIDADYVERVAFDLIVNFERMLGRRIPPAPLGDWLDYVALDGGLQPGDNEIRVYLVHRPEQEGTPSCNTHQTLAAGQRGTGPFPLHESVWGRSRVKVKPLRGRASARTLTLQSGEAVIFCVNQY